MSLLSQPVPLDFAPLPPTMMPPVAPTFRPKPAPAMPPLPHSFPKHPQPQPKPVIRYVVGRVSRYWTTHRHICIRW